MATLEEKINGLIKLALEDVNSVEEISIGSISKLAAEMVKEESGRNVDGYELIMDTDSIRHVYKRHPEQIRDLFLIPLILRSPDNVHNGNQANTIVFRKKLALDYACVETIADRKKTLRLKTFFVKNTKGPTTWLSPRR